MICLVSRLKMAHCVNNYVVEKYAKKYSLLYEKLEEIMTTCVVI